MLLSVLMLGGGARASAALHAEAVEYRDGEVILEGYVAYDDAMQGARPGVLVVHEWMGLGPYAMRRADQLARLGYAAFAADMYGKGIRAKDHTEAAQLSGAYRKDRALMRARIAAALVTFRRMPFVDAERIAAIGYCFGGTTVLELARSGADVLGVASFHGGLDTPDPADARRIRGRVLVLHGADDPFVPQAQVAALEQEMQQAGVSYRVVQYPGAVHSFTVTEAGDDPSKGMAYNEAADAASWQELVTFLAEMFQRPQSMHADHGDHTPHAGHDG